MTSRSAGMDISATPFFPAVRRGGIGCGQKKRYQVACISLMDERTVARKWAHWQFENKPRAAECGLIVGSNAPIVRFDDRLGHRQAQAHAGLLGRKETIEQMR